MGPPMTTFSCQICGVKLKQTLISMLYTWLAFAFLGYVGIYKDDIWYLYALIAFIPLFIFGYMGKVFVVNNDKNA